MNVEERLEEQEKENIELKAKLEVLQTANIQLVEETKIHEKNIAALDEKYQNEIAELKVKHATQNEVFEEKLKKLEEVIHANQQKISEAEDEIMMTIHQMKVLLPLENWHDLLAFVPRNQLGSLVSEIGDYQFTRIIQSFLHDGAKKITLGKMEIIPPRPTVSSDHPMVQVMPNEATNMPASSMPGNIKDFKEIVLNYLDSSVLHFLEKFQQNSLLADVNMHIDYNFRTLDENILPRVMAKTSSVITSIDSIESRSPEIDLFKMVYNNNPNLGHINESQLLLKEMMAKTRIIFTRWTFNGIHSLRDKINWYCSWLYTPRKDGKPRMLLFSSYILDYDCASFIERIKKDFEDADNAVTFFIHAITLDVDVEDISIDNVKTNEKLVIKIVNRGDEQAMFIWRHIEANENEITLWNRETLDRKITLTDGLTIGNDDS